MKILSGSLGLLLILVSIFLDASAQDAEVGLGLGLSPWDSVSKRQDEKKKKQADLFIKILARHFKTDEDELNKLWNRGYGRNELIKLLLISQKSGQELKEIIKQRDKKTRLSKLSEKYNLNYNEILDEQNALRKELDYNVSISTEAVEYIIKLSTHTSQKASDETGAKQPGSTITGEQNE